MLEVDGETLPRVILNICNLCPEIRFIDRKYLIIWLMKLTLSRGPVKVTRDSLHVTRGPV